MAGLREWVAKNGYKGEREHNIDLYFQHLDGINVSKNGASM